jgi:hypothetical protein
VVRDFRKLLKECSNDLYVQTRDNHKQVNGSATRKLSRCLYCCDYITKDAPTIQMSCCKQTGIHIDCAKEYGNYFQNCMFCSVALKSQQDAEDKMLNIDGSPLAKKKPEVIRQGSSEKKRKRQDVQAKKMVEVRETNVNKVAGKIGDVVSLKMDFREATQAHGITGIVFATSKGGGGGCIVATEHGVIGKKSGTKGQAMFIPVERYLVLSSDIPLSDKLQKIRNQILKNTFDLNKVTRISMSDAHHATYGRSTAAKGRCSCNGVCGPTCGCRRKKIKCSSSCKCYGKQCDNH